MNDALALHGPPDVLALLRTPAGTASKGRPSTGRTMVQGQGRNTAASQQARQVLGERGVSDPASCAELCEMTALANGAALPLVSRRQGAARRCRREWAR